MILFGAVPSGWHQVLMGLTQMMDKYWPDHCSDNDPERECRCGGVKGQKSCMFPPPYNVWLPITVNSEFSQRPVTEFIAVIRRKR